MHFSKSNSLYINLLYIWNKTIDYLAKKRATQWIALLTLMLQLTSFYPRTI